MEYSIFDIQYSLFAVFGRVLGRVAGSRAGWVAGGETGGGAVLTASCLCVQAPRTRTAERHANFREREYAIISESPGSEDRGATAPTL